MFILKIIFFFFTVLSSGYLLLLVFKKEEKSFLYNLALSYGLGMFFITSQIFTWIFLLKLKFNVNYFYVVLFLEFVALSYYAFRYKNIIRLKLPTYKIRLHEFIVLLLVLIQVFFSISNSLMRPVATFDSMAMWAFKSKVLYYNKGIDFNPESLLYLGGGGHINYPWLVPISQFWLHEIIGEYNDLAINIIFVSFYISTLIILFYFLRKYLNKFRSLVFVFFLTTMPLFFYHSYNAYADLVLSFYLLLGFINLIKWSEDLKKRHLIITGVFFGIAYWTKTEAIIYILAILPLVYIRAASIKKRVKSIANYTIAILLIILPWSIFKMINKLEISNVEPGLGFHPEVLSSFLNALFMHNSWNVWWYIVLVAFFINFKKIVKNIDITLAWLFLFISVLGFLMLYLFTEQYQFAVSGTALSRNILTLLPVSVAIVGMSFGNKYKKKKI